MSISSIIRGVNKYRNALDNLSIKTGIGKMYLYFDCLWSWFRHGCVLNQYIEGKFFLRKEFERKKILTYRRWLGIIKYNDVEFVHFLSNKLSFCHFFERYIGREYLSSRDMSFEDFQSFVSRYNKVFVKPVSGLEGRGISTISVSSNTSLSKLFEELKEGYYILEEPVVQHPDMNLGNKSVNTIRVYTTFDRKENKAFCIATTLRAGIGEAVVDNSHSGGLAYEIDLETGRVDSRAWGHQNEGVIFHPLTQTCMLGKRIPYWREVKELCEQAAGLIPQVPFIGWDVAITQNGPILIEGNHDPDLDIMEFVGQYGYFNTIISHLK